jgi:hypothetical protein
MATQIQHRRGTTSGHSSFTGAAGEITVDTDKNTVIVHNGSTSGGFPQVGGNSSQALSSAANAMTISGTTITLTRGDSSTDTVSIPAGYTNTDVDSHLSGGTGITYSSGAISITAGSVVATQLGVTAGTATANKALVVDSSKDLSLGTGDFTATNVTVTGTLTESSAAMYKENITPLEAQLANIMQLNPVEYDKKSSGNHEYGLIADEVQEIYPDFVGMKDGKADSLNYSRMVSVLVKAVQELTEKVNKLSK